MTWRTYKYIVVETQENEPVELPFMFPSSVSHDAMAEGIRAALHMQSWMPCSVVSAGFVNPKTLECSGRSEMLNLNSRPDVDTALFQNFVPRLG